MDSPTVRKYGSKAILMEWESVISPEINDRVVKTAQFLEENHADGIIEVVPSYNSLVVFLQTGNDLERYIDICRYLNVSINDDVERLRIWQVPACYDTSFGPDIESISNTTGLSIESIVQLHSQAKYRIYAMGFLPGFLYLGGLNEQIHFPRKSIVNPSVPKGAVAIGGKQTGIYPQKSPGGWNIIGRTPIDLFNPKMSSPTPFSTGDFIQFVPISLKEYEEIRLAVVNENYELKFVSHD